MMKFHFHKLSEMNATLWMFEKKILLVQAITADVTVWEGAMSRLMAHSSKLHVPNWICKPTTLFLEIYFSVLFKNKTNSFICFQNVPPVHSDWAVAVIATAQTINHVWHQMEHAQWHVQQNIWEQVVKQVHFYIWTVYTPYFSPWFQEGFEVTGFKSIRFKMADYQPLFTLICLISGKPWQIARPLL